MYCVHPARSFQKQLWEKMPYRNAETEIEASTILKQRYYTALSFREGQHFVSEKAQWSTVDLAAIVPHRPLGRHDWPVK